MLDAHYTLCVFFKAMTLDEYLAAEKLTEAAFAGMVGISQPHVNRLRSGKGWPARELAEKIREATGGRVTPDDFLPPRAAPETPEAAVA